MAMIDIWQHDRLRQRGVYVESSAVWFLGYDVFNRELIVIFNSDPDKEYRYADVSEEEFERVLEAPSIGKAVNGIRTSKRLVA